MKMHFPPNRRVRRGFTLIEVLVTLVLMAIVLPALLQGVVLSSRAADTARRRTEAAGLAEGKLSEIVSTGIWQNGTLAGDFADWPDYHWKATVLPWTEDTTGAGIQEIDLQVTWAGVRNEPESLALSTLAYVRNQQQ